MTNAPTPAPQRERDLFLEALERPTPEERAAFLDRACADHPTLRATVEALLKNHQDDAFLEIPALATPAPGGVAQGKPSTIVLGSIGEQPGDRIGRYKLLQQIGEGGVGVVFMAEQEEPLRRRVALKVLKPGMDTRSVIARFESERQALALMDHPNIAKVLDAGSTEAGRPYFVMELVRGVPITDYCDQNRLRTRDRLVLFVQVCQAIQHAHQKGVIHRDIKPSNVLVTLHDGVPVPMVIDFGIAKAVGQRLTDKTLFTEFHSFIGTPAYISPEQAEMSGLDIDTRTDIYSLGVLLYEMLVGRTPFDARELCSSGLDGMRRTIREREPAPPSTRLRTLPEAERTTTAQRQQAEPARLTSLLRGDLDWIVLKALEKDRARRYATANGLGQDIRRYLENEPVLARPPSAPYRFRKLVRRNQLVFAGAGAFAAALLIGLAVSTWQFLEKSAAYQRVSKAEQEQGRLRQEADAARQSAEIQALAARRRAYAADMNLVQQALAANNLGRAQALLDRHRPEGDSRVSDFKPPLPVDLRGWEWRYLWQQCQSDALFTLCQLSNEVSALSVSHDGKWVAVGEHGDRGISIWDLRARQEFDRFPAGDSLEPFAFSPVAPVLAFCVPDRSSRAGSPKPRALVRLWELTTRRVVGEFPVNAPCRTIAFSGDGTRLLVASGDGDFTVWSVAQATPLTRSTVPEPKGPEPRSALGSRLTVTRDLRLAAQALGGGQLRVVDLVSGRVLWTAQAADEHVTALAFSPDGRRLASGAGFVESAVRLWDVDSGRELARLIGHRTYVRALAFWPDGEKLASASGDQTIHLWEVGSLISLAAFPHPSARASAPSEGGSEKAAPAFRPPADPPSWLGLASSTTPPEPTDQTPAPESHPRAQPPLRTRPPRPRVVEAHPSATLRGHGLEVWSLALCADETTLVSGSKDGAVLVWDTSTLRRNRVLATLPVPVRAFGFVPGGPAILALDERGRVARWQGVDFQQHQPLLELGTNVFAPCFSPDGRFMATATPAGPTKVWDPEQGLLRREIASPEGPAWPVAFLGRSNHLVTQQGRAGQFREWDVTTGQELRSWRVPASGAPGKSVFSLDGRWMVVPDNDGAERFHPLAGGEDTQIASDLKQVSAAALSPDGRLLAMVSILGMGEVWDTAAARKVATLQGFLQGTHSVAFSPDGQRLAVGSNGNEALRLWDVASLQEVLTLSGQGSLFNAAAFSPDGHLLAARNGQGLLHIWRAPAFEDIARLEAQPR